MSTIASRLAEVQSRIAAAAERAGRKPDEITLVAVSKTHSVAEIQEALTAGLQHLGENYAQELRDKHAVIGEGPTWHFVGHVQKNKVKYIVPACALIHSVDSVELAEAISRRAVAFGRRQAVLVEVNVAGEVSKSGVPVARVEVLLGEMAPLPGIEVQGLMAMPLWGADPEEARPWFRALRELRDDLGRRSLPGVSLRQLSMGMTADYQVAIEEGATIVRIGTAIFGPRAS
jgi:pyridoxal phosphate enzyme (YggS family)